MKKNQKRKSNDDERDKKMDINLEKIFETGTLNEFEELMFAFYRLQAPLVVQFFNQFKMFIKLTKVPSLMIDNIKLANDCFSKISLDSDMTKAIYLLISRQAKNIIKEAKADEIQTNPDFKKMIEMIHDDKFNKILETKKG